MNEALSMGGYGAYVWTSFGLTAIVMITCVMQARFRQARKYNEIAKRVKAKESAE